MNNKSAMIVNYPRYIQTQPTGLDKFEGESQVRLAKAIAHHIVYNDELNNENALPKILGLQGEWGSGKTNVVKLLKKELKAKYYFFEYDAWGHQEDLQRRSILELLTTDLIDIGFLSGDTKINIKGGRYKTVSWQEKLKYLLARKTETITEKFPRISNGMAAMFIVGILTPIFTYIAYAVKPNDTTWWFTLISIFIAALPVIVSLIIWWCAYHKDKKYDFSYLLAIYNNKIENDVCYETLSEDEPTVKEFKDWMTDISNYIQENQKPKLILVFDNMDRLPAEKVKELWSSIHTFFADDGFDNIWAIIPFDKKHLVCAFNGEDTFETEELTHYFISKTFPVVFRVAPPLITDYINLFDTLFTEAFEKSEDYSKDLISRIYRIVHPEANVREIIMFINALVSLRHERDDVTLINIAVFKLFESLLLEHPVIQILSGDYLKALQNIISNDIQRQSEISALVYGVDIERARQIPISQYISKCFSLDKNYDINKYAESNPSFDQVLLEVVLNLDDALLNGAITSLDNLHKSNKSVQKVWANIALRKIKQPIDEQILPNEYKILLLKVEDSKLLNRIVEKLCANITNIEKFKGSSYYNALHDIDIFIKEHDLSCTLTPIGKQVDVENFIDYLHAAQLDYLTYKLSTDTNDLDAFCATKAAKGELGYSRIVAVLIKDEQYTFSSLYRIVEQNITTNKVTVDNVGEILETYRILSNQKPLEKQLDVNLTINMWQQYKTTKSIPEGYCDVAARALVSGHNITFDEKFIPEIAQIIDYYDNYETILLNMLSWNHESLNKVVKYMILNNLGDALDLKKLLPKYDNIKTRLKISDEELLTHFAKWIKSIGDVSLNEIQKIIPDPKFYHITAQSSSQNILTDKINKLATTAVSKIPTDDLYKQRANYKSDYWYITIEYLLNTPYMQMLPNNIAELGKKLLLDIASGNQPLPLPEKFEQIIKRIDKRTTVSTSSSMRDLYCNGQASIDVAKFIYLEPWLRTQGHLADRASDTIYKILQPVIINKDCRQVLIEHSEFYVSLINSVGEEANGFRQIFADSIKGIEDDKVISFAKSIGINADDEQIESKETEQKQPK